MKHKRNRKKNKNNLTRYVLPSLWTPQFIRGYKKDCKRDGVAIDQKLCRTPSNWIKQQVIATAKHYKQKGMSNAEIQILSRPCMEEHCWYETGQHVIFPETPQLIRDLNDASYQIDSENFTTPFVSFILAMPAELNIFPCVVRFETLAEQLTRTSWFYTAVMGLEPHMSDAAIRRVWGETRETLPDLTEGKNLTIYWYYDKTETCDPLQIPIKFMPQILSGDMSYVEDMLNPNSNPSKGLAEYTTTLQKLVKVVSGFCIYTNACDGVLVPGLPNKVRVPEIKDLMRTFKPNITTAKQPPTPHCDGSGKRVHFRKWHFRSARTRKDGTKSSKPVFVRAAIVNEKMDPWTALELKQAHASCFKEEVSI